MRKVSSGPLLSIHTSIVPFMRGCWNSVRYLGHNLGTFYARKKKFLCYLPRPKSSSPYASCPWNLPCGGAGVKLYKRSEKLHWHLRTVFLGSHNLSTFYARKFKFTMLLTQLQIFNSVLNCSWIMPCGLARDQNV